MPEIEQCSSGNQKEGFSHISKETHLQRKTSKVTATVKEKKNIVREDVKPEKKETSNVVKSNDGFWD